MRPLRGPELNSRGRAQSNALEQTRAALLVRDWRRRICGGVHRWTRGSARDRAGTAGRPAQHRDGRLRRVREHRVLHSRRSSPPARRLPSPLHCPRQESPLRPQPVLRATRRGKGGLIKEVVTLVATRGVVSGARSPRRATARPCAARFAVWSRRWAWQVRGPARRRTPVRAARGCGTALLA